MMTIVLFTRIIHLFGLNHSSIETLHSSRNPTTISMSRGENHLGRDLSEGELYQGHQWSTKSSLNLIYPLNTMSATTGTVRMINIKDLSHTAETSQGSLHTMIDANRRQRGWWKSADRCSVNQDLVDTTNKEEAIQTNSREFLNVALTTTNLDKKFMKKTPLPLTRGEPCRVSKPIRNTGTKTHQGGHNAEMYLVPILHRKVENCPKWRGMMRKRKKIVKNNRMKKFKNKKVRKRRRTIRLITSIRIMEM
jgi:hypothetical protein